MGLKFGAIFIEFAINDIRGYTCLAPVLNSLD